MKKLFAACAMALVLTGCASGVKIVDTNNDTADSVMGLEYRDFEKGSR